MALNPEFMKEFSRFQSERDAISSEKDWLAFKCKWFDAANWPLRPHNAAQDHVAAEKISAIDLAHLDGRAWARTYWAYALTPEARYEYFATLSEINRRLRRHDTLIDLSRHWSYDCPFCEISTPQVGGSSCPICGRGLVVGYSPY